MELQATFVLSSAGSAGYFSSFLQLRLCIALTAQGEPSRARRDAPCGGSVRFRFRVHLLYQRGRRPPTANGARPWPYVISRSFGTRLAWLRYPSRAASRNALDCVRGRHNPTHSAQPCRARISSRRRSRASTGR